MEDEGLYFYIFALLIKGKGKIKKYVDSELLPRVLTPCSPLAMPLVSFRVSISKPMFQAIVKIFMKIGVLMWSMNIFK